jgi:hypothetical protein
MQHVRCAMRIVQYVRSLGGRILRGKLKPDAKARLNLPPPTPVDLKAPRSLLSRPPSALGRASFGSLKRRPFGRNTLRRER